MSAIIYETVNLYNKEKGILPYRYIGSDQHSKPGYLGSNKQLLLDADRLGKDKFIKKIVCEFKQEIPNTLLRKIESQLQSFLDTANDPTFYNRTNNSHKGYNETEKEKQERVSKLLSNRRDWWNSLTEEQKQVFKNKSKERRISYNKSIKGKTYEEIYGEEKAKAKRLKHSGGNNGKAKRIMHNPTNMVFDSVSEAMKYYQIKYYSVLNNRIKKGEFIIL